MELLHTTLSWLLQLIRKGKHQASKLCPESTSRDYLRDTLCFDTCNSIMQAAKAHSRHETSICRLLHACILLKH